MGHKQPEHTYPQAETQIKNSWPNTYKFGNFTKPDTEPTVVYINRKRRVSKPQLSTTV